MADSPLTESLAALARFFVNDGTLRETLDRIVHLTVEAIGPADLCGLTMTVDHRLRTAVFTDPTSPEIDQAQYDSGEGPCLEALRTGRVLVVDDTTAEGPWPAFRRSAAGRGIRSTLSLPMRADDGFVGAMNLYARAERTFSAADQEDALQFARQAAIVASNAQAYWEARDLGSRLGEAMASRATIEQAKGILMGAQRCDADEAFDLLRRASQRENVKLRDIAQRLVDSVKDPRPADDGCGPPLDGPSSAG